MIEKSKERGKKGDQEVNKGWGVKGRLLLKESQQDKIKRQDFGAQVTLSQASPHGSLQFNILCTRRILSRHLMNE